VEVAVEALSAVGLVAVPLVAVLGWVVAPISATLTPRDLAIA